MTGRPATRFGDGELGPIPNGDDRHRLESFGRASPAAAAAPAPRKSRRETDIVDLRRGRDGRRIIILRDRSRGHWHPRRSRRPPPSALSLVLLSSPPMSPSAVRDRLRQAEFLEGLTDSALHQLAKLVTPVTYECDDVLFEEGSARDVHRDHHLGRDRGRERAERTAGSARHARRGTVARRGTAARRLAARHERARRAEAPRLFAQRRRRCTRW